MTLPWIPAAAPAVRGAVGFALGLLLVLTLSACSSEYRATDPEEVRRLAGSAQAQQPREEAEGYLRALVRAYDERTPLALGLVALEDHCAGGREKEWFFVSDEGEYKVRCTLSVTAYYGGDPRRIGDLLDGVFTAGDRDSAGAVADAIAFPHDYHRRHLVDYYRGRGPNPTGPGTTEPAQVFDPSTTLSWDTLRSSPRTLVPEADPRVKSDPPLTRHLREPAATTVADIREQYGMVFELKLSANEYYRVSKSAETP